MTFALQQERLRAAGVSPEVVEILSKCDQDHEVRGEFRVEGGELTDKWLTGVPGLDDIGGLLTVTNNTFRWLINGVVQKAADWQPPDRRHVIEGGCGLHVKGPLYVDGPIFCWKTIPGGTTLFFALTDGTITARVTTTPGTGTVDLLDSSLTATGESVTVGNPYGSSIADSTYVTVGILDDGTYGITGSDCP